MATRQTLTAKKPAAAAALADLGPYPFPKRSDFVSEWLCDWKARVAGNAAGVAKSWANEKVRAARLVKNGVRVRFDGKDTEYKSVAEAFRVLRLPFEKHIKFRLALKASRKEIFATPDGRLLVFTIAE